MYGRSPEDGVASLARGPETFPEEVPLTIIASMPE